MAAELKSPPTADLLAMEFCATHTPEQMEEVVALNAAETNPNVRHRKVEIFEELQDEGDDEFT